MNPRRPGLRASLVVGLVGSVAVSLSACGSTGAVATTSLATTTTLACTTSSALASWSLPQLIRETITVPVEGTSISQALAVGAAGYGGVLVFGDAGPSNFAAIVAAARRDVPDHGGLMVMTDDEGGEVWRLANLIAPIPWARDLSSLSSAKITALATKEARLMSALGITVDLAPVLDIDGSDVVPGNADADGYRSFSGTASVVATDGVAFMKGLSAGGVLSVVKHFPGLGGVSPNTDVGAASTKPWSVVTGTSLSPFRAAIAAGARAIMISNATIPGLTTGPATLSSSVYSYLRHQMGFTGLLMTDSLSAGAITDAHVSLTAAAVDAIAAGANDVLFGLPATSSALATANAITEAIFNAVATHRITRATLVDDASQVLVAKSVNLCTS